MYLWWQMKILQINSVFGTGSTGRIALGIHEVNKADGGQSVCLYGRGCANHLEAYRIGNQIDVFRHALLTRVTDKTGLGSRRATKEALSSVDLLDVDLVQLHNIHGYYINIEELCFFLSSIQKPVVWTFHDCWPLTGHCAYFTYAECDKWESQCAKCPSVRQYPASWGIDNSRRNYQMKRRLFSTIANLNIVTPSNWLREIVSRSFFTDNNAVTIPNGINLQHFARVDSAEKRKELGLQNKYVILGVANPWTKRKGIDDFCRLSELLGQDCRIVLVGPGLSGKRVPTNITTIPGTENVHELALLYSMSDVFVNPTHEDNFPTTNLEALACGTPVITYPTGGSPESVSHTTGIVTSLPTSGCLAEAIAMLRSQPLQQQECIKRAHELYDENDRFRDYLSLYRQLVDQERFRSSGPGKSDGRTK